MTRSHVIIAGLLLLTVAILVLLQRPTSPSAALLAKEASGSSLPKDVIALQKEIRVAETRIAELREVLKSNSSATISLVAATAPIIPAPPVPNPEADKQLEEFKAKQKSDAALVAKDAVPATTIFEGDDPQFVASREKAFDKVMTQLRKANFDLGDELQLTPDQVELLLEITAEYDAAAYLLYQLRKPPIKDGEKETFRNAHLTPEDNEYISALYMKRRKATEELLGKEKFAQWMKYQTTELVRREFLEFEQVLIKNNFTMDAPKSKRLLRYYYDNTLDPQKDEFIRNSGIASDGEFKKKVERMETFDRGMLTAAAGVMTPDEILILKKIQTEELDRKKAELIKFNQDPDGVWRSSRHRKPLY